MVERQPGRDAKVSVDMMNDSLWHRSGLSYRSEGNYALEKPGWAVSRHTRWTVVQPSRATDRDTD